MNNRELRDHFAGLAMQAIMSSPRLLEQILFINRRDKSAIEDLIAEKAYHQADAILLVADRYEIPTTPTPDLPVVPAPEIIQETSAPAEDHATAE